MNKIVGILSMQKVLNYGSFLQAYGLKQLLLKNGASDVFFLDIEQGHSLPGYECGKSTLITKMKIAFILFFNGKLFSKLRDNRFRNKLNISISNQFPILGLDKQTPSNMDVAFIGSDEVFNCCQDVPWGYTKQLYGFIPQAEKVVTYAGSFGHATYEQLQKAGVSKEIAATMRELSAISVRDKNSFDIVERLIGVKSKIHLDPVLAYGYKSEIDKCEIPKHEPYILVYSYLGRITDKDEIKAILAFAKWKKLKVVSVFCRYDWCNEAVIPDTPFDVLAYFKGANYIITDTFHGTIFSIITHSLFCTLVRNTNMQKIDSLLQQLNLKSRMVVSDRSQTIFTVLCQDINYENVEAILESERAKSIDYIREQLN